MASGMVTAAFFVCVVDLSFLLDLMCLNIHFYLQGRHHTSFSPCFSLQYRHSMRLTCKIFHFGFENLGLNLFWEDVFLIFDDASEEMSGLEQIAKMSLLQSW